MTKYLFSKGLVLLTNDYAWVEKLTHPRYERWKDYSVTVAGHLSESALGKLRSGLYLPGEEENRSRKTLPAVSDHFQEKTLFSVFALRLSVPKADGMLEAEIPSTA